MVASKLIPGFLSNCRIEEESKDVVVSSIMISRLICAVGWLLVYAMEQSYNY